MANGKVVQVVPLLVLFTSLFKDANGQQEQTRLKSFRDLLKTHSQEEIKGVLRVKTDKEKLAPFVVGLMSQTRMAEQSARQRHSDLRTMFKAYMDGFPIDKQTLFPAALIAARDWNKAQGEKRSDKKFNDQHGALISQYHKQDGKPLDVAVALADAEMERIAAVKAAIDVPKIGQALIDKYGLADALAIGEWVTRTVKAVNKLRVAEQAIVNSVQPIAAPAVIAAPVVPVLPVVMGFEQKAVA